MTQPRIGIYPGTFDPITNGHADIIRRAIKIVDRLIIGVARNDGKGPLFPTDERVEIVRDEVAHLENGDAERIEVRAFDSLLVNFAQSVGATVGEAVRQATCDPRADKMRDVAAQRADFLDEARRDELKAIRGHQKDGLDLRVEPGIHAGHLELVFEIGNRPQPANDHGRPD